MVPSTGEPPHVARGAVVADLRESEHGYNTREGVNGERAAKDKSLAELFGDLSKELSLLVHEEIQLARVELADKAKKLAAGGAMLAAAAVLALLGAGVLCALCVIALAIVLPWWLSSLIVAALLLGGAAFLGVTGAAAARKGSPPVPKEAMESTKEDVAWLQKQLKSAKQ
ncbi:MAG TPA: phage holin family protein [Acidimicrobiales bacterium]|nr:phage holin family protein [Acidimicrobiales bacterium]